MLNAHGYHRYEVSNHARPGQEALHNSVYWHVAPFIAAGPSAAAYLPSSDGFGIRVTNPPIKGWLAHTPPERESLDATTYLLERLMTGLRTSRGVDLDALATRTGIDPFERFATTLEESMEAGWLVLKPATYDGHVATQGRRLRATDAGLLVLDAILRRFFAA